MASAHYESFLVGGLLVLIGSVLFMAWSGWRYVDREREMETLSLRGIGHELRLNLLQFLAELRAIQSDDTLGPGALLPISFPQLDGVLSRPSEADRRALSVIRLHYDALGAHKLELRGLLAQRADTQSAQSYAIGTIVQAIASLYLWEQHKGRPPTEAHKTRSWHVRAWMKTHGFRADLVPNFHLRDAVVERLRSDGMALTPKPLSHTASQYYAKRYHRKSDPNAPFWRRKPVQNSGQMIDIAPTPIKVRTPSRPPAEPVAPQPAATPEAPIRVTYGPVTTASDRE